MLSLRVNRVHWNLQSEPCLVLEIKFTDALKYSIQTFYPVSSAQEWQLKTQSRVAGAASSLRIPIECKIWIKRSDPQTGSADRMFVWVGSRNKM